MISDTESSPGSKGGLIGQDPTEKQERFDIAGNIGSESIGPTGLANMDGVTTEEAAGSGGKSDGIITSLGKKFEAAAMTFGNIAMGTNDNNDDDEDEDEDEDEAKSPSKEGEEDDYLARIKAGYEAAGIPYHSPSGHPEAKSGLDGVSGVDFPKSDDGFSTVSSTAKSSASVLATKEHFVGIKVTRNGSTGATEWSPTDVKNLLSLISEVDPNALFLDHSAKEKSHKTISSVKKMLPMDMAPFFDMQVSQWGHASEEKERSTMSFYIATNIVSANLREIREYHRIKTFLQQGNCSVQSTRLTESVSKPVTVILNKDPDHTYRVAMAQRFEEHLRQHSPSNKTIPVNIVAMPVGNTRACVVTVGSRDEVITKKILKEHPFPHLELLPYS